MIELFNEEEVGLGVNQLLYILIIFFSIFSLFLKNIVKK